MTNQLSLNQFLKNNITMAIGFLIANIIAIIVVNVILQWDSMGTLTISSAGFLIIAINTHKYRKQVIERHWWFLKQRKEAKLFYVALYYEMECLGRESHWWLNYYEDANKKYSTSNNWFDSPSKYMFNIFIWMLWIDTTSWSWIHFHWRGRWYWIRELIEYWDVLLWDRNHKGSW